MILLWTSFVVFIVAMLAIDLFLLHRKAEVVPPKAALQWTGVCVVMALLFAVAVYFIYDRNFAGMGERFMAYDHRNDPNANLADAGHEATFKYLTGWLVEYSLSFDNIMVIAMIFGYFRVPGKYQHRVLFWGILGALVMRGGMIAAGSALLESFHWIIYVFGALLIVTAIKMLLTHDDDAFDPGRSPVVRVVKRVVRVSPAYEGEKFFTRVSRQPPPEAALAGVPHEGEAGGGTHAPADPGAGHRATFFAITPLFLVLLTVEATDVIFAVDSIPAIFTITRDPFLVFTSNVFAILGLRSLYFALAGIIDRFRYLKPAIAVVLIYIGLKMIAGAWKIHIDSRLSLAVVAGILTGGVVLSWLASRKDEGRAGAQPQDGAPPTDDTGRKD
jgi:tellurite resistance protein TerC